MPFVLCADFGIFPDDFKLGPNFVLSAMTFQDLSGSVASFVNETLGERGLQFADGGLEVELPPVPVPWARMRVGHFASPFTIEGVDPSGTVISAVKLNSPNSYKNVVLRGPDLAFIRFVGGGNEASIVSLCALIP